MSIATSVRECLARFVSLQDNAGGHIPGLEDEYGRFRTWVGNIAAHRTGRRSLEYRLRDSSNLRGTVTRLLNDLQNVLDQLEIPAGQKALPGEDRTGDENTLSDGDELEAADDEDDAALFGLDDEDESVTALFDGVLDEVHEVIGCLLRFSMTLRNPARHDQLKQAAVTTAKHFEPHDIKHVEEKHPLAPDYLQCRLGKAVSKHRQYFKYREEHHVKLSEGLDEMQEGLEERPSTIATSLHHSDKIVSQVAFGETGDDAESVYTATSYAPTTAGDAALRPPPLPEAGQGGEPFECPLCYGIIVAEDQRSWRQHVYEDLPPYVCTFEHCVSADTKYSRRRDWQRHQAKFHNRHWVCPFGCPIKLASEAEFRRHLAKSHDQNLDNSSVQRMMDACAVANESSGLTCVLCKIELPTAKRWYKHVGHHLEQLALHALPHHVLGTSSDEEPEIVDDSEDQSLDVSPSWRQADFARISAKDERSQEALQHSDPWTTGEGAAPTLDHTTLDQRPADLPEGWIRNIDSVSGQYYYVHLPTQSTQWEFPTGTNPNIKADMDIDVEDTELAESKAAIDGGDRSADGLISDATTDYGALAKGKTRFPVRLIKDTSIFGKYGISFTVDDVDNFYVLDHALTKQQIESLVKPEATLTSTSKEVSEWNTDDGTPRESEGSLDRQLYSVEVKSKPSRSVSQGDVSAQTTQQGTASNTGSHAAQASSASHRGVDDATSEFYAAENDDTVTASPTGNHALQDFQMQLMLLEQQNKKRLLMARQEQGSMEQPDANPNYTSAEGTQGGNHASLDYKMQLMLLEQQNKKPPLTARQEQDSMAQPDGNANEAFDSEATQIREETLEGQRIELAPDNRSANMISVGNVWDRVTSNTDYRNGKFSMDDLTTELRSQYRTSATGPVIDQRYVDAALYKLGKGVPKSITDQVPEQQEVNRVFDPDDAPNLHSLWANDLKPMEPPLGPGSLLEAPMTGDEAHRQQFEKGLSYVDRVKLQYSSQPEIYSRYLEILQDFQSGVIDTPGVIGRITSLFAGNTELIHGFNAFLPSGYRIECRADGHAIRVHTPMGESNHPVPPPLQRLKPAAGEETQRSRDHWTLPPPSNEIRERDRQERVDAFRREYLAENVAPPRLPRISTPPPPADAPSIRPSYRRQSPPLHDSYPTALSTGDPLSPPQPHTSSKDQDDEPSTDTVLSNQDLSDLVKRKLASRPDLYDQYRKITQDLQSGAITGSDAGRQVGTLFAGEPELLRHFRLRRAQTDSRVVPVPTSGVDHLEESHARGELTDDGREEEDRKDRRASIDLDLRPRIWNKNKSQNVYPKIHQDYLSIDTLRYYDIPWEYDEDDPNYLIILREMDRYETQVLFEHTKSLRARAQVKLKDRNYRSIYDVSDDIRARGTLRPEREVDERSPLGSVFEAEYEREAAGRGRSPPVVRRAAEREPSPLRSVSMSAESDDRSDGDIRSEITRLEAERDALRLEREASERAYVQREPRPLESVSRAETEEPDHQSIESARNDSVEVNAHGAGTPSTLYGRASPRPPSQASAAPSPYHDQDSALAPAPPSHLTRTDLDPSARPFTPRSVGPKIMTDVHTCDECGKVFGRLGDLERHKRERHSLSRLFYRCDECPYDDYRLDKVKAHCRSKHGQPPGLERWSELSGQPQRVKRSLQDLRKFTGRNDAR